MIKNIGNTLIFIAVAVLLAGCGSRSYFESVAAESGETEISAEAADAGDGKASDGAETSNVTETSTDTNPPSSEAAEIEPAPTIFVQVAGEVATPGVYELAAGSRIYEAIEAAGGITDEADVRTMNQAQPLSDGEMIYIPAVGEEIPEQLMTGSAGGSANGAAAGLITDGATGTARSSSAAATGITADGRVNLNAATQAELMTLPGIGEAKARLIISYREANGDFSDPSEIMRVQGIKEGTYEQIKALIVTQ